MKDAKTKALKIKSESYMQERHRLKRQAKKAGGRLSETGFTVFPNGDVK